MENASFFLDISVFTTFNAIEQNKWQKCGSTNRENYLEKQQKQNILENCWTPRKNTRSIVSRFNIGSSSKIMNFTTAAHKIWVRNVVNKINDSLKNLFFKFVPKTFALLYFWATLIIIFHKNIYKKVKRKSNVDLQSSSVLVSTKVL